MITKEAVIFNAAGIEVDWYSPVGSTRETKRYWFIELKDFVVEPFKVYKRKGYTMSVRYRKVPEHLEKFA